MTGDNKIVLDDAYDVQTPSDSIHLYAQWAKTYDTDFVAALGYVNCLRVAEQLGQGLSNRIGAVLDVGCGTGIGGIALRAQGFTIVDGVDISKEMLCEARMKRTADNESVYRYLIKADLTQRTGLNDSCYDGIVSAGTFTHGHLGPDPLTELWRVAAPGAICAIAVNAHHFATKGFKKKIDGDVMDKKITELKLIEIEMYENAGDDVAPENRTAIMVACRVL